MSRALPSPEDEEIAQAAAAAMLLQVQVRPDGYADEAFKLVAHLGEDRKHRVWTRACDILHYDMDPKVPQGAYPWGRGRV